MLGDKASISPKKPHPSDRSEMRPVKNEEATSYAGAVLMEMTEESDSAPICGLKRKSKPVEIMGFFPMYWQSGNKTQFLQV